MRVSLISAQDKTSNKIKDFPLEALILLEADTELTMQDSRQLISPKFRNTYRIIEKVKGIWLYK